MEEDGSGEHLTMISDRYVSMNRASRAKTNMSEARVMMKQAKMLRKKRDIDFLERVGAEKAHDESFG